MFKQLSVFFICVSIVLGTKRFPNGFKFGAATAAYQIEGAWNVSDKGESICDNFVHNHPDLIAYKSNADVACDSYHLYKRDVEIAKELGLDFYRFSISWPRLLPTGRMNNISEDGTRYYNNLIDELISKNITPVVTLYHWDLPQELQDLGGWANPLMANYFEKYAKIAFKLFGDRVKTWLTFNEPSSVCLAGYGQKSVAPAINQYIAALLCGHTLLLAHAKAYHNYDKNFRKTQGGRIGTTLSAAHFEPASNATRDKTAANNFMQFFLGWFANPIFSKNGDYPQIMKYNLAIFSVVMGYDNSILPSFNKRQINYIKGTADFFGLNHYTTSMVKAPEGDMRKYPPLFQLANGIAYEDPNWPSGASSWLKVVPFGFKKLLKWISNEYNKPEMIIFENGYSDKDGLDDQDRVNYLRSYLKSLLEAINEGCNVTGYTVWSLIDNFEWAQGFGERFGIYHVDYNSKDKIRTPKASAKYYKKVIKTKKVH